jgi:multiple sugar transport system substrate-binding protein
MKKIFVLCICVLVWTFTLSEVFAQETGGMINVMYTSQSGYHPDELKMLIRTFNDLTGIDVNIDYVRYENQYEKIIESAPTYDVLSLDQLWLADFVSKGLLAPLDDYITKRIKRDIAPAVMSAFQYQNRTWAFPFLVNFQLLFYNEKMLKAAGFKNPPKSLEGMIEQMKVMKEKGIVEYPWTDSWEQSEGLVSEFVWLIGAFGGDIFDQEGNPIFDQEPGVKALQFMVMLLKEQLANPAILTNDEIAAKDDFITGQAAFTSNWIFQYGFLDDPTASTIVKQGKMGLLPTSETITAKTASVGGFQGIAMTAGSEKKEAAWKWMEFFTSPLVQRAFLFEMPIWTSVQTSQDANILDAMMAMKREQLLNVHHRPNIPNYSDVSLILQKYIYLTLKGRMEVTAALEQAKIEIEALMK